jgi:hypothetical protein
MKKVPVAKSVDVFFSYIEYQLDKGATHCTGSPMVGDLTSSGMGCKDLECGDCFFHQHLYSERGGSWYRNGDDEALDTTRDVQRVISKFIHPQGEEKGV